MGSASAWTSKQNKLFENALVSFDKDSPDRWLHLARAVGGKTVDEVKTHYQMLLEDVHNIETGDVLLPNFRKNGDSSRGFNFLEGEQRLGSLKLH